MRKMQSVLLGAAILLGFACKQKTIVGIDISDTGQGGGGGSGACSAQSTVSMSPKSASQSAGSTLQASATWNCSGKVRWYSTDASRVDVVQHDTTFSVSTFPWGTGTFRGGFIKFLAPGTVNICVQLVDFPSVKDCGVFTTTGSSANVSSVVVSPQGQTITLALNGGVCSASLPFTAQVIGSDGQPFSNQGVSWTVTSPGGGISSSGLFTGTVAGVSTIIATSAADQNVKGTAQVTVVGACTTLSVTPVGPINLGSGTGCTNTSASLTANVPVTWSTSNSSIATVVSTGTNTATVTSVAGASGTVTITATPTGGGTPVSVVVNVSNTSCNTGVTSVTVLPSTISTGNGAGCQANWSLVVNTVPINQPVTWTSSNTAVVTVNSSGVVTVVGVGTAEVRATASNGVYGFMTFTVTNTACNTGGTASISYTPAGGTYAQGTIINPAVVCTGTVSGVSCAPWWYSTDPSRWTVDPNTGRITNIYPGVATICVQWSSTKTDPRFCAEFRTP